MGGEKEGERLGGNFRGARERGEGGERERENCGGGGGRVGMGVEGESVWELLC